MEGIDVELYVDLPCSVEELLAKICFEKRKPPVDADVRRRLAALGEPGSLEVLRKIEPPTVAITSTLNGYIIRLLERYRSPASTPEKAPSLSGSQSPARSPKLRTVRLYSNGTVTEAVAETVAEAGAGAEAEAEAEARLVPCSLAREVPRKIGQAELEALGEMEFRKQFLILNYLGRNELHKVTSVGDLKRLKDLPIIEFEARVWERFGVRFVKREDRRVYHDWDSGKTHLYDCCVSSEGFYTFKGPFLSKSKTHLQKVLGDDNVLRVKFAEEENGSVSNTSDHHYFGGYNEVATKKGILVGLRKYFFFVFKDGGNQDKKKNPTSSPVKCFFIRLDSDALIDKNADEPYKLADCKTISEARLRFMHAHTVSSVEKYMARFSLILSKTFTPEIKMTKVNMEIVEDIYCKDESGDHIYRDGKPLIHTDGTGFISEDLALMCPKNIYQGICNNDKDIKFIHNHEEYENGVGEREQLGVEMQEPPMLIQCRLFNKGYAVKGTLLVNKTLGRKTIWVRESMVKVERDPKFSDAPSEDSLEIVGTSYRPNRTNLSKTLIALLSHGGVPNKFFLDLLDDSLSETNGAFSNENAALKVAMNKPDKDSTIARMILCGIPLAEPYLKHWLTILLKEQKTSLKGGKIYVPESFYLMGTADPTGILESDEVCIVLENGQVSGKVLVYRNPGVHFGDVHVMNARYIKQLESVVGNAKFAIFFSTKGSRNVADEIGGGDFDGDSYWISRNPTLLQHFKPREPWIQSSSTCKAKVENKKPSELSGEELEDELFKLFLRTRFQPSYAIGEAADGCLALMDRYLTLQDDCTDEKIRLKDNITKLIQIYYDALDAPKNGLKVEVPKDLKPRSFPHYMEKKNSFVSTSILGDIYDKVTEYLAEDHSSKDVWKLPQFEVDLNQVCQSKWKSYYRDYRAEMFNAMNIQDADLKNEAANQVIRKYKKLLYGGEELEGSTRNIEDIFNEALAIYHECYDHAINEQSPSLCSFAWKVAGSALCKFLISKQVDERAFLCLPSALRVAL